MTDPEGKPRPSHVPQMIGSLVVAGLLVAVTFFVVARATRSGPSSTAVAGTAVRIVDFGFEEATVVIQPGQTVTWTNGGGAQHTVTSDSGAFGSQALRPGATFSHAFSSVGAFAFHCEFHPQQMKGTVVVAPPAGVGY